MLLLTSHVAHSPSLYIGEYYTDAVPGLAFYTSARDSLVMRVYWFDSKKKGYGGYKDFVASKPSFGASAPDDSYHRLDWTVDNKRVTFEWGKSRDGIAIRVRSSGPVKLMTWFAQAWPGSTPAISLNQWGYGLSFGNTILNMATNGVLTKPLMKESSGDSGDKVDWGETTSLASVSFRVTADKPGLIVIQPARKSDIKSFRGLEWPSFTRLASDYRRHRRKDELKSEVEANTAHRLSTGDVPGILDSALARYQDGRAHASGDWDDFVSPIQNEMGHSRVFSCDTGRLSEIVSRNWCLPDGQVLFCWDSFFNGVLTSIENPEAGRQTVRAILAAQQPSGLVPNFAGRGWGVSADRSQPPVGALCVWKMYQRDPDVAFLREVFPKLLKWHRWWFTARDGNRDGLLEWGSQTGVLQNAKFESGLDDSPMFDTADMSGPHMTLDSVDLNALWAMDAEYLAKIATIIGEHKEAAKLLEQRTELGARMNTELWNPALGTYCYRYWNPRQARRPVSLSDLVSTQEGSGFRGEYFSGRNFERLVGTRQDANLNFDWSGSSPFEGISQVDYSVRWTADFKPKESGQYLFKSYSDDGIRVWLDDQLIVDDWKVQGTTESDAAPLQLDADKTYKLKVEYFQAAGGASCRLELEKVDANSPAEVFYNRLSPLNFYPMMAGIPGAERAKQMLGLFFKPEKFGGDYMCPTISRDDPAYPAQGYWRGTVWGPTNYLFYQGLRRYGSAEQRSEFARKSVALFMKNWNADGTCHENFNAMTGIGRSDPHYSWGALLCLIGIEDLCDIEPDGKLRLNGGAGVHVRIKSFRLGGKTYDLSVAPTEAELSRNGRVVYRAVGKAKEFAWK